MKKFYREMLNQVQHVEYVESGRSMVEMLGVLAVIGVLSIAGIAGYTTAMRSYRTNEIVNAASMLYVMGMATNKGEGTGTLNYSDIGTNPKGVSSLSYNNKEVTINITDSDDCAMVKNKLGDKASDCPSTATAGVYALTVNFGETTSNAIPVINLGDACSGGLTCGLMSDGNYHRFYCDDGHWDELDSYGNNYDLCLESLSP